MPLAAGVPKGASAYIQRQNCHGCLPARLSDPIEQRGAVISARDRLAIDDARARAQAREGLDDQREAMFKVVARAAVEADTLVLTVGMAWRAANTISCAARAWKRGSVATRSASARVLGEPGKSRIDVRESRFSAAGSDLNVIRFDSGKVWVHEHGDCHSMGSQLAHQLQPLRRPGFLVSTRAARQPCFLGLRRAP
jgi:hypothetical protein